MYLNRTNPVHLFLLSSRSTAAARRPSIRRSYRSFRTRVSGSRGLVCIHRALLYVFEFPFPIRFSAGETKDDQVLPQPLSKQKQEKRAKRKDKTRPQQNTMTTKSPHTQHTTPSPQERTRKRKKKESKANPPPTQPNGTNQWQGDPDQPPSINDIHYTLELHTHLTNTFCIDPSATYASGKSNGGGFTGLLACSPLATRKFAAFAAVAGAFYLDNATGELPPCRPTLGAEVGRDAVPFMELHGLRDGTIAYGGGWNSRGNARSVDVRAFVGEWAERDGLAPSGNTTGTVCKEEGGEGAVTTCECLWGTRDLGIG